jgi:hypothetical protein
MQYFLDQLDAILAVGVGCWLLYLCLWKRDGVEEYKDKSILSPLLGAGVAGYGVYLFFVHPEPVSEWQWVATLDGRASAEFPVQPKLLEAYDELNGTRVHRVIHAAPLASGNIEIQMMYNPYALGAGERSKEERLSDLRELFASEGLKVLEDYPVAGGFQDILLEAEDDQTHLANRIFLGDYALYAVVATSLPGHHEDPRIRRFLASFNVSPKKPQPGVQKDNALPAPVPEPSFNQYNQ